MKATIGDVIIIQKGKSLFNNFIVSTSLFLHQNHRSEIAICENGDVNILKKLLEVRTKSTMGVNY